jgi:hypothetical protein
LGEVLTADLCVVGAGSGGFGAACAAARLGARVVLLEAADGVGGTSTWAGVNNWEPVAGGTGLCTELYEHLRLTPDAVCLQKRKCSYHPERPWGWYDRDLERSDYRLSLSRRTGVPVTFEPQALDDVMQEFLAATGCCDLRLRTSFTEVDVDRPSRRIRAVLARDTGGDELRVEAAVFVDATADTHVARGVGCRHTIGPEGPDVYSETSASCTDGLVLNNASPCYRIAAVGEGESTRVEPLPDDCDVDADDIRAVTSIRTYPNGDLNMNPLHLMTGAEAYDLGSRARDVAFARARLHWHVMQTRYAEPFGRWRRTWMSPALGVRETYRLVGRYVLREQDIDAGLAAQEHDDIVAIADHSVDFHGARPSRELTGPYGIPYRCLLPLEIDNLLVACRGASFSSIGASSCRLSRTMMMLGQAAGTAAALFGGDVAQGDPASLRQQLVEDGAAPTLEHGWLDAMTDVEPTPADERMPRKGVADRPPTVRLPSGPDARP